MIADLTDQPILITAVGGAPGFDLARILVDRGYQVIAADADPYAAGLFLPGVTPRVLPLSGDDHYTAALLDALPERSAGKHRLATIPGVVPGVEDRPQGCLFHPRCRFATEYCVQVQPALAPVPPALARCHYALVHGIPTNHPSTEPVRA